MSKSPKAALTARKENGALTLSVRPADLFKGLAKGTIKFLAGQPADAASEIPEIAAAVGLKERPEDKVWILALRSLERALTTLIEEQFEADDAQRLNIHAATFVGFNDEVVLELRHDFLERPEQSNIVSSLYDDAVRWLEVLELDPVVSRNLANRLNAVFSRALHDEWRSNPGYYEDIQLALKSPFGKSAEIERSWSRYRSYLVSMAKERVFDESFGLDAIYIWPRAYYYSLPKRTGEAHFIASDEAGRIKRVRLLGDELRAWLEGGEPDDSIRVVSGGPGAGKSSFAKMFASELAEQGRKVLFIPLHLLELETSLTKAVGDYLREAGFFDASPMENLAGSSPLILILDGLDELQMQGKGAQDVAQSLVLDLTRLCDRVNSTGCRLQVLITGRELAVQSAESAFKAEGQVLHMVPYFVKTSERREFNDPSGLLRADQRDQWWKLFSRATGKSFSGVPIELKQGEIGDVTSQPLLNYLVALSFVRGEVKLGETTSINDVYADLLEAVYQRGWSKNRHPSVQEVGYRDFVRLLEEVALAVWHGAGRTTTLSEVEEHCKQSKIGDLLPNFTSGVSTGVSTLLLAFYFRQKGRRADGEKTFEFTHKSFAEYLASLRIVRAIEQIHKQYSASKLDPDTGWDADTALHRWLQVFGPTPLDTYLMAFARREIARRGKDDAEAWQKSMIALLETSSRTSWPISRVDGLRQVEQLRWIRNSEEALVASINACARVSRALSKPDWPQPTYFGEMLKRLQGQRLGPANALVMECLSFWDCEGAQLDMADLYAANLEGTNLRDAELHFAILMRANLDEADLRGAAFLHTNFLDASLAGTLFLASGIFDEEGRSSDERVMITPRRSRQTLKGRVQQFARAGAAVIDDVSPPEQSAT